ncbi:hypothetical protein TREMEDRAFT_65841 [Tremella mesenterica DSM 1558]|uniref:uncharacterized protein n=1 Tax=Tremella mesenterica (strain ATCC 24925 / CBS 8224 / DSM 1558 / NBRC 9311 / NRRL Y-6157 / RJB 2259-6 / UBC 559-6) TaxID=578456 RepID=UPI00032C8268|nr:uncharacterized protein TREMEDRAFT_65841 [Tremella mesenterica DSM 1558]EIW66230.1 hypothetical protein TREMEDRAFT_65841 [Tremella mesenterica DSM 1558]
MNPEAVIETMASNRGVYLGPQFLGCYVDGLLLGTTLHLFVNWCRHSFFEERRINKVLVFYSMFLCFFTSIFILVWKMEMFVYDFGDYRLLLSEKFQSWVPLLDGLARVPVSAFFAHRAWRITGSCKYLGTTLFVLILTTSVGSIVSFVFAVDAAKFQSASEVATNIIITSVISLNLWHKRTGWETMTPPTVISLVFLIMLAINPTSPIEPFLIFVPKVYFISLLVVLNSKRHFRAELESNSANTWGGEKDSDTQRLHETPGLSVLPSIKSPSVRTEIHVAMETETKVHTTPSWAHRPSINRDPDPLVVTAERVWSNPPSPGRDIPRKPVPKFLADQTETTSTVSPRVPDSLHGPNGKSSLTYDQVAPYGFAV